MINHEVENEIFETYASILRKQIDAVELTKGYMRCMARRLSEPELGDLSKNIKNSINSLNEKNDVFDITAKVRTQTTIILRAAHSHFIDPDISVNIEPFGHDIIQVEWCYSREHYDWNFLTWDIEYTEMAFPACNVRAYEWEDTNPMDSKGKPKTFFHIKPLIDRLDKLVEEISKS